MGGSPEEQKKKKEEQKNGTANRAQARKDDLLVVCFVLPYFVHIVIQTLLPSLATGRHEDRKGTKTLLEPGSKLIYLLH